MGARLTTAFHVRVYLMVPGSQTWGSLVEVAYIIYSLFRILAITQQFLRSSSSLRTYTFLAGWPSTLARSVATCMARAIVERTLPSSRVSNPAIVQPPGALMGSVNARVEISKPLTGDSIFYLSWMGPELQDHSGRTLHR